MIARAQQSLETAEDSEESLRRRRERDRAKRAVEAEDREERLRMRKDGYRARQAAETFEQRNTQLEHTMHDEAASMRVLAWFLSAPSKLAKDWLLYFFSQSEFCVYIQCTCDYYHYYFFIFISLISESDIDYVNNSWRSFFWDTVPSKLN